MEALIRKANEIADELERLTGKAVEIVTVDGVDVDLTVEGGRILESVRREDAP